MKTIGIVLLAFTMVACSASRGFDRGYLKDQISDQKVINDQDIKKVIGSQATTTDSLQVGDLLLSR